MQVSEWIAFYKSSSKSVKAQLFLCGICAAVAVVGCVYAVTQVAKLSRRRQIAQVITQQQHREVASIVPAFTFPYELKGISVGLTDRGQVRSAEAQFVLLLDCPSAEAQKAMLLHRARLLDLVFESTARLTVEDFEKPDGLAKLKKYLLEAMRDRLGPLAPRDVAFNHWVVQ